MTADESPAAGRRRPGRVGRPPVTSRGEVLAAARRLIERDGWERLTIRKLAAELGIGAATLYHHVRDKEGLLLLLLNEYAAAIAHPELPPDPRERIVVAADALHRSLSEWPWVAEVLATDGFIAVMGEPAVWTVETILDAAIEAGCTDEQAVVLFRSTWYYTVGEILVRERSARARAEGTGHAPASGFFRDLDPTHLPRLSAIGDRWPVIAARDTYRPALEAFVRGLVDQAADDQR